MGEYTEKLNLSKSEIKFIEKVLKHKRESFGRREIMVLVALVMIPVIVCLIGIFLSPARVSFSFSDLWEYSKCPEMRIGHIRTFAVVIIFMFLLYISRDLKIAKGILKKIASSGILNRKTKEIRGHNTNFLEIRGHNTNFLEKKKENRKRK